MRGKSNIGDPGLGLAENLKRLRMERNLTHRELGDMAGIGHSSVSSIERGKVTNPGCYLVYQLALALRVPMEDVMGVSRLSGRVRIARNYGGESLTEILESPIDSPDV